MAISAQHTRFQFNEYVSPIASEDLIKVALKKQEMYDEGRNKIKQVYDNYSQLRNTIINENARNYFDQEFGKLVKGIQANAGLDFANIGNVEAVINLGKPFENDKYIKNALENGAEAQRRYAALEKMDKSQRNNDNDLVYLHDIMEYQRSGGLDTKLQKNKSYESYIDIRKKLEEAEKLVDAEETYAVQKGSAPPGYFEQVTIKRKRAEDIYNRAMSFMNPDEQRQLQIHAQADMYRLGSDAVYQTWVGHNKEQKLISQDVIKNAKRQLGQFASIPPNQMTAEQIQTSNYLQKVIAEQESMVNAAQENINMNPDDFDIGEYTGFFTKRFVEGFAKRMAFENKKLDLKEDVAWKLATQHSYELSRISAQEASSKRVEAFKTRMNFTPSVSVSTNLLKGVEGLLTPEEKAAVDGEADMQKKFQKLIETVNGKNIANKALYVNQLNQLYSVYKVKDDIPGAEVWLNGLDAKSAYRVTTGNFKTMPIWDAMQTNTIELGKSPTYQEKYDASAGNILGEMGVYNQDKNLFKEFFEAKKPSTGQVTILNPGGQNP